MGGVLCCDVSEGDASCHLDRDAFGEGSDLGVNVCEVGGSTPSANFHDILGCVAIELQRHCPGGS